MWVMHLRFENVLNLFTLLFYSMINLIQFESFYFWTLLELLVLKFMWLHRNLKSFSEYEKESFVLRWEIYKNFLFKAENFYFLYFSLNCLISLISTSLMFHSSKQFKIYIAIKNICLFYCPNNLYEILKTKKYSNLKSSRSRIFARFWKKLENSLKIRS